MFQVIHKWRKQAIRTKLLIISPILIIITSIIGVWAINLASHEPSSDITHFFVGTGLHIKDEEVYANGTINFSVYCKVTVSGGYAIPEGILYNITQTFVCSENDLLEFDKSIGDIQDITNVTIVSGDIFLEAAETVTIRFQTSFPLQSGINVYIGVLAEGPSGYRRWDLYTPVLPP